MKDLAGQFGLRDFLGYLCPGGLLLLSTTLWVEVETKTGVLGNATVLALGVVTVAYTLGLAVSAAAHAAYAYHLRLEEDERMPAHWWGPRGRLVRWLVHFPSPRVTPALVHANLHITDELERLSGMRGLSSLTDQWQWLAMYRTLVARDPGSLEPVLAQAEAYSRRAGFCMSVAVALVLIGASAAVRLVVDVVARGTESWTPALPAVGPGALIALAIVALASSWGMRLVAVRQWELEQYLTASLAAGDDGA